MPSYHEFNYVIALYNFNSLENARKGKSMVFEFKTMYLIEILCISSTPLTYCLTGALSFTMGTPPSIVLKDGVNTLKLSA